MGRLLCPGSLLWSSSPPLAYTGWWRASYSGDPWAATASDGTSGAAGTFSAYGGNGPAVGAAQNGLTPADFDGVNDAMVSSGNTSAWFTAGGGSVVAVFRADSGIAQSAGYDDASILTNANAEFALTYTSTQGVSAVASDGAFKIANSGPVSTGAYHIARMRWNGATLGVTVDSGAEVTTACGPLASLGAFAAYLGQNYSAAAHFDGRLLDVRTLASYLSDADFASVKADVNARYALSL